MNNKMIKRILCAVMVAAVAIGIGTNGPNEVYADQSTKTAILNNAQISFDGGEPVTVQTYLVDRNNYVRARDITNALDMDLYPLLNGETGIMIIPFESAEATELLEHLDSERIEVQMVKGNIYYDGQGYESDCFYYNGRYFFKLADIVSAANKNHEVQMNLTRIQAEAGILSQSSTDELINLQLDWDGEMQIISLNRDVIDLHKVFNEIKGDTGAIQQTDNVDESNTVNIQTPIIVSGQPPLTEAPEVGVTLARILYDESKGAYLDNEMTILNDDNITAPYKEVVAEGSKALSRNFGQCTWYAGSRFFETTGISPICYGDMYNLFSDKPQKTERIKTVTDPMSIECQSIAVWDGHVVFIEYIEYDNGIPHTIYFTEANSEHDGNYHLKGVYYPGFDGIVKKTSFSSFITWSDNFFGYIIAE